MFISLSTLHNLLCTMSSSWGGSRLGAPWFEVAFDMVAHTHTHSADVGSACLCAMPAPPPPLRPCKLSTHVRRLAASRSRPCACGYMPSSASAHICVGESAASTGAHPQLPIAGCGCAQHAAPYTFCGGMCLSIFWTPLLALYSSNASAAALLSPMRTLKNHTQQL